MLIQLGSVWYHYCDVSDEIVTGLIEAESASRYFNARVGVGLAAAQNSASPPAHEGGGSRVAASPSTASGQPNEAPDDQERDVAALLPMTLFAISRDNDSADENHTDKDRRYDGTNYSLLIHWPGS
jgi:hypothetical protein